MDTRTGKIHEFTEELARSKLAEADGRLTPLTPQEHMEMRGIPEADRPRELAVMRFCAERAKLRAVVTPQLKNAFRMGWKAAVESQGR